jgi:hypothetical protein
MLPSPGKRIKHILIDLSHVLNKGYFSNGTMGNSVTCHFNKMPSSGKYRLIFMKQTHNLNRANI